MSDRDQTSSSPIGPIRAAVAVIVLAGTLYVGAFGLEPLPPLGPFLDPAAGVWAVARSARLPGEARGAIPNLGEDVEVTYDRRGVPHIWASNTEDAVRALGYVVARDRLFQLELQTRAPEGTLTELAGSAALEMDRGQRRLGMAWSAERELRRLDAESQRLLTAFADGVNAWIDAMGPADLPFEYRLLDARPRRWEPIHSILLTKQMGHTLTYLPEELWRSTVEAMVGKAATDALFPVNDPIVQPIQPNGSTGPRFDFTEPPPPGEPTPDAAQLVAILEEVYGSAAQGPLVPAVERAAAAASNNWAVAPSRTAGGHALLSGDPHLELTLPSIWYEVHMVVPGTLDVHGVTIPGFPGVVIGFTRDVAWSFTNTGADVLDFYRETVDDAERPSRYSLDGTWEPLERRIETYRNKRGRVLATDTVYFTHRGPMRMTEDGPLSMRWTVLDQGMDAGAFARALEAHNVDEWLAAMASYPVPAQNMVVADRDGNIAIRSTGLFPIRPGSGDGLTIRDGSTTANDWQGYWPLADYPGAVNPAQGYLASANQQPLDPALGRRYLGANWPGPWRAIRINQLLAADSQVTPDAMRRFQTDPGNVRADLFLPAFLEVARDRDDLAEPRRVLEAWDRRYTKDNEAAILFELALNELDYGAFDELLVPGGRRLIARPNRSFIIDLLHYPENVWWDDRRTDDRVEHRDDILAASLEAAYAEAVERYGEPDAGGWRWSEVRHNNVNHLIGIPALSRRDLAVQGGPGTLNPSSGSGNFGASWRMVVELAPEVRAWSTYPGGQSGNPASPWYADRIAEWVDGRLDDVIFPRTAGDLDDADVAGVLSLTPAHR